MDNTPRITFISKGPGNGHTMLGLNTGGGTVQLFIDSIVNGNRYLTVIGKGGKEHKAYHVGPIPKGIKVHGGR